MPLVSFKCLGRCTCHSISLHRDILPGHHWGILQQSCRHLVQGTVHTQRIVRTAPSEPAGQCVSQSPNSTVPFVFFKPQLAPHELVWVL